MVSNNKQAKNILVIGGGAAGMMAAIAAASAGGKVTLFEKNEKLGKKLYITGKGRCNVTNACDPEDFFANIVRNPRFMYSSFKLCSNDMLMALLESYGVPLKTERGNRVFPVSDHSSDIIRALADELKRQNVRVCLNYEVKGLLLEDNSAEASAARRCVGVIGRDGKKHYFDHVIVATGGLSYPSTGSTGDGLRFAEKAGLKVNACLPSLVPFEVAEPACRTLSGLSLKNVAVRLMADAKEIYSGFGEMLFTHFGVSGPLILSASAAATEYLAKGQKLTLHIDLKPALSEKQLNDKLIRLFTEGAQKSFKNAVASMLPARLLQVILDASGLDQEKKSGLVSKQERADFIHILKDYTLTVIATRGYPEAVITRGGVDVKAVSPTTMKVKGVDGLSFAGEVLDVDALTGGFNLQIAWSTGFAAGTYAVEDDADGSGNGAKEKKSKKEKKKMNFQIAIDGPAGAGKSTIAKKLAEKLNILYVDTGAMYRAVALYLLENDIDLDDETAVSAACLNAKLDLSHEEDGQHVFLNGKDVNGFIRTSQVSDATSRTSAFFKVRQHVVSSQQEIAKNISLIMDGRDIGTVVLPDAPLKIYLTADPGVRAKRRYDEMIAKGETCDYETILEEIKERDHRDMTREVSPLRQAEDAVCVDTSYMSIDEVVDTIYGLCKERMN
ncbi:MAG: (d)CMP kinase [Lachnospiraceae bacterium]|nr:(d)CMP kinase [Lachnospiraceae bacterium]